MKIVAGLLFSLMITGCSQPPGDITRQHQVLAFGTIIDITIRHPQSHVIEQAFKRLHEDFLTMHDIWHPWEPGVLSRTNQLLQTGEWFTASMSILPLLQRSKTLAKRSDHYFNPAIGELIRQWGFHRHDADQPFTPNRQAIRKLQQDIPTMLDIEMNGITMRGLNKNIRLDLGGIAKGFGIDQAIKTLRLMGIKHAIINAGGDLKAIGQHNQRPWKVGIQHPRKQGVLASIDTLSDESIFTSGDYQRFYMQGTQRRHHVIDPLTGEPVSHTIAVTVIHPDATIADAAATAILAAGKNKMADIAKSMGVQYVLLMTSQGELYVNSAMLKRLQLNADFNPIIHLIAL